MADRWRFMAHEDQQFINGLMFRPINGRDAPGVHVSAIDEQGNRVNCGNILKFVLEDGLWRIQRFGGVSHHAVLVGDQRRIKVDQIA